MRLRALLIAATTLLGVMALSGVALAATKTCSANPCVGTNGPDWLKGTDAKNEIRGLRGPDYTAGKQHASLALWKWSSGKHRGKAIALDDRRGTPRRIPACRFGG